jgi:hypothetical protein
MSPFVACCLLPASAIARCCWFETVCVIPMPTKPLYTQFYPSPTPLRRTPCRSIPINLPVVPCHSACFLIFPLMTFFSRHASYVCAICCDRCALDVFCFFSICLSSFNPCVIAFVIRRTFTVTPPGLFSRIS